MSIAITKRFQFIRAFHSRSFTLLWAGQTISSLGDGAFNTAVAWQVLTLTGSATMMGLVMIAQTLPMILFLLLGGVIADRFPRKLVMLWSDASRAIAVLLIAALAMTHLLQIWHLIVLSFFFGAVRGFFMPAYQSIIPQLIEKDDLASANSLTELSYQLYILLGPMLGATCVALAGTSTAFAFDGLTFGISALCLLGLRLPASSARTAAKASSSRGVRGTMIELREGIRYVAGSTFLWVTIVLAALTSIGGAGAVQVALPKLVQSIYKQDIWLLGIIWAVGGVGSLIALPLVTYLNRLRKQGLVIYLAMAISGAALIAFGLPSPRLLQPAVACIAMTVFTFGQTIGEVLWITVMQETVPDDKLGRVNSINQLAAYGFWPLGFILAGWITDRISPTWVFIGAGVSIVGFYGLALLFRSIRQAPATRIEAKQGEDPGVGYRQQVLFPDWPIQATAPLPGIPSLTSSRLAHRRPAPRRMMLFVAAIAVLELAAAVPLSILYARQLGPENASAHPAAPAAVSVGEIAFSSSEQFDPTSSKGLNDTITVSLHNLATAPKGQSYYAWLMPDPTDDDTRPLLLGKLSPTGGKAQLTYVHPDHQNLLISYSGFKVAEQPGDVVPVTPPLDPKSLPYIGSIPSTPAPGDKQHYSLLDHLRHLLATDPTLQKIGLQGGLDIWLYRNAGKIQEWSSAARDSWTGGQQTDLVRRHMIRILDYLDGGGYVYSSGDVPPGSPLLVDPLASRIGLLEVNPTQELPAYLTHVDHHLQGLINAPGHSEAQLQRAVKLDAALAKAISLLQKVHQDAIKLVKMDATQLKGDDALTLLNDMTTSATDAYSGQFDTAGGGITNGIIWIHHEVQGLATIPVIVN
jgi:MFS family permease